MNFERIALLLCVVHKSMNVPGTDNIRAAALAELKTHNEPFRVDPKVLDQPELTIGARKL
jgi:hypothetical protein